MPSVMKNWLNVSQGKGLVYKYGSDLQVFSEKIDLKSKTTRFRLKLLWFQKQKDFKLKNDF